MVIFVLCLVFSMLTVSLDCPFVIASFGFSLTLTCTEVIYIRKNIKYLYCQEQRLDALPRYHVDLKEKSCGSQTMQAVCGNHFT